MARKGASFAWLLRLFLAGAAVATLGLLYTTHAQHAVDVEPQQPRKGCAFAGHACFRVAGPTQRVRRRGGASCAASYC